MWLSNTATAAMMAPLASAVIETLTAKKDGDPIAAYYDDDEDLDDDIGAEIEMAAMRSGGRHDSRGVVVAAAAERRTPYDVRSSPRNANRETPRGGGFRGDAGPEAVVGDEGKGQEDDRETTEIREILNNVRQMVSRCW